MVPPPAARTPVIGLLTRGNPAVTRSAVARRLLLACLLVSSSVGLVRADNWPQWRGPEQRRHQHRKPTCRRSGARREHRLDAAAARHGRLHADRLGRPHLPHQRRTATTSCSCASAPHGKELWKRKLGSGNQQGLQRRGQRRLRLAQHRRQARLGLRRHRRIRLLRFRRQGGLEVQRPGALRQVQHRVRHAHARRCWTATGCTCS